MLIVVMKIKHYVYLTGGVSTKRARPIGAGLLVNIYR